MSGAAWAFAALSAVLAGAFVITGLEARARGWDWLWLPTWPLSLPVFWVGRKINRYRSTCPECGRYFGRPERRRKHERLSAERGSHDANVLRPSHPKEPRS